jgi:hypothetical protein
MALETGTYISDLVSTNPVGTDTLDKADDHLRLIKSTLQATFPSITGAVTVTHTDLNKLGSTGNPQFATIELGAASDTTLSRSAAGVIAVEGVAVPLNSITNTHTAQQIELGHATDTTISRVSAGVIAVEGKNVALNGTTESLTTGTIELGAVSDTTLSRVSAGLIAVEGGNVPLENRANTFSALQTIASGGLAVSGGNALVTGSGGLGYGTGSGGTVTQITSRATGVTINKTNGAITMFTAAGSSAWSSFFVTNSTVSATDTIVLSLKSFTNTYLISPIGIGAGGFSILYSSVSGTASDAPVINFSVIKAVTA